MTTMDRMRLIKGHLEAVSRGRSPGPDQIGVWLRELEGVPAAQLDECIREARAYHVEACDRGKRWGRITPDDVLSVARSRNAASSKRTGSDRPPENPDCPIACESGQVLLVGSDGYNFVTRCSCFAGEWWAQRSSKWRSFRPAGEYLENPAFKLARSASDRMPESHVRWLQEQAEKVGMPEAMKRYNAHMAQRGKASTSGGESSADDGV